MTSRKPHLLPTLLIVLEGVEPDPVETMLRIHFMQQWFTLSASGHVNDVIKANALLHGEENDAFDETPDVKASGSALMSQAK